MIKERSSIYVKMRVLAMYGECRNCCEPNLPGHLFRAKLAFGLYDRWLLLQESKAKEGRERKEAGGASGRLYIQYGSRAFFQTDACP